MSLFDALKNLFSTRSEGEFEQLAKRFNSVFQYDFKNEALLSEALTHRSYTRGSSGTGGNSYERLEFLGDAALDLIVAEELYRRFPAYSEGELTKLKSLLVNETSLARFGGEAGLGEFVRLSPEEEKAGGRQRASILADCFEASLGAIYLDGSIDPVRDLVKRLIMSRMDETIADESQVNFKGELLEYSQARGEGAPVYESLSEEGPDHLKTFVVAVKYRGEKIGAGHGSSKKEAEQQAARVALETLRESNDNESEITE